MGKPSGKAKEVAGAVTGNDSLTAGGCLQQAEVTARQEAATAEAVADAQRTEAAEEIAEKARLAAQHMQVAGDRAVAEVQAKQHKDAAHAELRQDLHSTVIDQAKAQREHAAATATAADAEAAAAKAQAEADALAS
jgi:uncharacterized protein YjbJ (UPF0337 family)